MGIISRSTSQGTSSYQLRKHRSPRWNWLAGPSPEWQLWSTKRWKINEPIWFWLHKPRPEHWTTSCWPSLAQRVSPCRIQCHWSCYRCKEAAHGTSIHSWIKYHLSASLRTCFLLSHHISERIWKELTLIACRKAKFW